ncbi:hypothetical protein Lgee_0463 [Legionella geestiana]|uniref:Uncharacterized protein n=2 Tax=Legionella geestiana TaxID=45065 RepID=A0A0W0U6V7_9GAMM|nr:hypothetical protein [Legionella geestiana]KTD03806.1 hypothetical protein Lgee_0463 [Legionella geestiana]QBS11908.1 hypothetical protein E4T54_03635 [Legionella geestiana]STX53380.1 Uncharacterised protein [Legionella geestiana]
MFLKNRDYFQGYVIKRLLDLVNYLTEVIKQTDKSSEHKYALVDYFDKKGSGYCRVHTIGTGVISDFKPSDIMIDDDFISGFNHLDVRTISNLAHM